MEVGKLTVERRQKLGKGASRQLRTAGRVPGVCYGATKDGVLEPFAITVDVKALRAALDPVRKQNTVIDLTVTSESGKQQLSALLKDYQVDAIRREVTHVDLLAIDPNKEVLAEVPIEFTGKPAGAINGGQLRALLRSLEIRCVPASIPVKFVIDISALDIGDVLHVSDVELPAGVTTVTGLGQAVATCAMPDEDKTAAATPAAAEAAPDAKAAAGAKGAAPAKAGAAPAAAAKPDAKAAAAKPAAKK